MGTRSDWTGAMEITLGLSMPVKLSGTGKDGGTGLHMYRRKDASRINFTRIAAIDGNEVPWSDIAKGYEATDGSIVMLDKTDFEQAWGKQTKTARLLMFTDPGNVPPLADKTSYWVRPDTGGQDAYALLANALLETGKVAVVSFAMHERVSNAVLRAHDGGYLSLSPLLWNSEIVQPDFDAPLLRATDEEKNLVRTLIGSLTEKYNHAEAVNVSGEALMKVIQAKLEAGQVVVPAKAAPKGRVVVNLADQLKEAVAAQQAKAQPEATAVPVQRRRRGPNKAKAV